MPFEIVRNDIVKMDVDAIVNTSNPKPVVGTGVDFAINTAAGEKLIQARKKIGELNYGEVAITPGFDLDAKYVIHAAGPSWQGGDQGEEEQLASCYRKSLELAKEHSLESIAFPLLSTGNYGYPKGPALQVAIREFSAFLMENEMLIYLVVFGPEEVTLSENLVKTVEQYIDENYVEENMVREYATGDYRRDLINRRNLEARRVFLDAPVAAMMESDVLGEFDGIDPIFAETSDKYSPNVCETLDIEDELNFDIVELNFDIDELNFDIDDLLENLDAGFSDTLLALIDETGEKDSYIYKKANVDRKLFSKIRNNPDYKPSKATALAFALALELDLYQTKDLIGRAGYALSNSSKFDVIVEFFIKNKNYNIFELNEVLFKYDQPLIGV